MSDNLTNAEKKLATRVGNLRDAAARPQVDGLGMLGDALNFIGARVPLQLIRWALVIVLGFYAWDCFTRAQQAVAILETKRGEAGKLEADALAINSRIGGDSAELAKLKAELEQLQADARTTKADYEANATIINGAPARLATIRAEIEKIQNDAKIAQADYEANATIISGVPARLATMRAEIDTAREEARKADYELDAQNQIVNGIPMVVAQKKAEIEALLADAKKKIANIRLVMSVRN
jgi:chromosome segregation ATPase